jgi:hypothetical protein
MSSLFIEIILLTTSAIKIIYLWIYNICTDGMKPSFTVSALNVFSNLLLNFFLSAFVASTKNEMWIIAVSTTNNRFDMPLAEKFKTWELFRMLLEMTHQKSTMFV